MCNRRLPGRVRQRTRSSRCWRTTTSWWRRSSNTRTRTRTGSSRTRSSQDLNTTSCERGASDEPTPCRKSHPELITQFTLVIWQRLFLRSKVIYRDFTWKPLKLKHLQVKKCFTKTHKLISSCLKTFKNYLEKFNETLLQSVKAKFFGFNTVLIFFFWTFFWSRYLVSLLLKDGKIFAMQYCMRNKGGFPLILLPAPHPAAQIVYICKYKIRYFFKPHVLNCAILLFVCFL